MQPNEPWSRGDKIAFGSLIVGIIAVIIAVPQINACISSFNQRHDQVQASQKENMNQQQQLSSPKDNNSQQNSQVQNNQQSDVPIIKNQGDFYKADFSGLPKSLSSCEWQMKNNALVYTKCHKSTAYPIFYLPVDIETFNYSIEAEVQMTFSSEQCFAEGGLVSDGRKGNIDNFYIAVQELNDCDGLGRNLVLANCGGPNTVECGNNVLHTEADIEGIKVVLRLEVRGTILIFYVDKISRLRGKASTLNNARVVGVAANNLQSMIVYRFEVKGL